MSLVTEQHQRLRTIKETLQYKRGEFKLDNVVETLVEYIEVEKQASLLRRKYDALTLEIEILKLQNKQSEIPSKLVERDIISEQLSGW